MTEPIRPHPVLHTHYTTPDERPAFVRALFDHTAPHYDQVNSLFSLGTGASYRRHALRRAGLRAGMRTLDVAIGTGLVARAALSVAGSGTDVIGVDVSERMLREARGNLDIPVIQGHAEALPIADASVDFVSMGYALRHMADLACAFREFGRVLRPGGILLLLEIGRPSGRIVHAVAALYLGHAVPWLCRKFMPRTQMATLMQYYWDTIENCVPPDTILAGLSAAGFTDISCENSQGLFRAYRARKAYQGSVDSR